MYLSKASIYAGFIVCAYVFIHPFSLGKNTTHCSEAWEFCIPW